MNLAQQVAAVHDGTHAHACGFGEELPQTGAAQQRNREGGRAVRELEELDEHDVHDGEQHQWLEHRPQHTKIRALVAQLEVGLHQLLEYDQRIVVPLLEAFDHVFHKRPILLMRDNMASAASVSAQRSHIF